MLMRMVRLTLLVLTLTTGCAAWLTKGETPEVLITDIAPLESTPFEQRFTVKLRIRNPNDYDLQVTGLDFRLELNGKRLARGLGNREITIPRLGDSVLAIETSTSMLDIVRQVLGLRKTQTLTYGISGLLYLKDGRLPFENSGVLTEQGGLPGILAP